MYAPRAKSYPSLDKMRIDQGKMFGLRIFSPTFPNAKSFAKASSAALTYGPFHLPDFQKKTERGDLKTKKKGLRPGQSGTQFSHG